MKDVEHHPQVIGYYATVTLNNVAGSSGPLLHESLNRSEPTERGPVSLQFGAALTSMATLAASYAPPAIPPTCPSSTYVVISAIDPIGPVERDQEFRSMLPAELEALRLRAPSLSIAVGRFQSWDELNTRRIGLIKERRRWGIGPQEESLLGELQTLAERYLDETSPLNMVVLDDLKAMAERDGIAVD